MGELYLDVGKKTTYISTAWEMLAYKVSNCQLLTHDFSDSKQVAMMILGMALVGLIPLVVITDANARIQS